MDSENFVKLNDGWVTVLDKTVWPGGNYNHYLYVVKGISTETRTSFVSHEPLIIVGDTIKLRYVLRTRTPCDLEVEQVNFK